MIRFGLCCIFFDQPISFRRSTAKHLLALESRNRMERLSEICLHNARSLVQALSFCRDKKIGDFRINSQLLPLYTHPDLCYNLDDLPAAETIRALFSESKSLADSSDIRRTFHPDQFVVLSSPKPRVVASSVQELVYQAELAELVGADVINVHGGGGYGDKSAALDRLKTVIEDLPSPVRTRLTLENDDRTYTPEDLVPVCADLSIPLVYDVHHHRCLQDSLTIEEATSLALDTWEREPLFHISSPIEGWQGKDTRKHHDFLDPGDFPEEWCRISRDITVEVEAKAKEAAVLRLMEEEYCR